MIRRTTNGSQPDPMEAPCWQVIAALAMELANQQRHFGGKLNVSKLDDQGRIRVDGTLDLAGLANAAETGLRAAFEADEGDEDGD